MTGNLERNNPPPFTGEVSAMRTEGGRPDLRRRVRSSP